MAISNNRQLDHSVEIELDRSEKYNADDVGNRNLFLLGFLFPPAWFVGSTDCCQQEVKHGSVWKKQCKIAATLRLTGIIVAASKTAIRPGVPVDGSNIPDNWNLAGVDKSL
ncbi:hypothetical protein EC973_008138 [Apophysomyces ossiformis]|uniref:Uncharacterized protein n=1 Tax=Apophysomyces ossiformis TaxID=679940 RepID=A0A8H7EQ08_9FUNG|nr:hypothetical protein EC973_008138 [Apophysomyces ossiformis]